VLWVGFRIDADPRAVELPHRAFALTSSVGADLASWTRVVAGATMVGIGRRVDTGSVALHVAGVTHDAAGSVEANRLAIGWRIARSAAIAAVVRVAFEVATRAVTQAEACVAAQLASARVARRSALAWRSALGAALPTVEDAGFKVDAGSRTVARTRGAARTAGAVGTHLTGGARLPAGAAVPRVAGEVDAASRALGQAGVAGRPASASEAFRTRPRRAVTTHTASAAVRGARREVDAAVAAQRQRVFTQRHAATVDAALLRTWLARACRMAAAAVVRIAAELDALVATHRLALRAHRGHDRLVRLARREAQLGRDVASVTIDAAALVVASEPAQIPIDVARACADEHEAERES